MLTIRNLHKRYGETVAVADLSLEVRAGEIFGLLGPNGAGKSTIVHIAVGVLPADEGQVIIDGKGPPSDPAVRQLLGIAPQALAIYDELTADENLRFFGRMYGLRGKRLANRIDAVLELARLTDRRASRVSEYSGGMKRRINLAAALLHEPKLLIMDEPTAGVDPQSRNALLDATEALRDGGTTVVYTTHYMEEAERICDRIAVVDQGKVLALDTLDNLIEAHGGTSTLVAELNGESIRLQTNDPLTELNQLSAKGSLDRFHVERPSLEQVFLNLTGRSLRD